MNPHCSNSRCVTRLKPSCRRVGGSGAEPLLAGGGPAGGEGAVAGPSCGGERGACGSGCGEAGCGEAGCSEGGWDSYAGLMQTSFDALFPARCGEEAAKGALRLHAAAAEERLAAAAAGATRCTPCSCFLGTLL